MRQLPCYSLLVATLATTPALLPAQTPTQIANAAETITAKDIARHVGVIADDSMMGRDTPSRGLEMTAQYVADQLQKLGLIAGGDSGSWFQRYTIPPRFDFARSQVTFAAAGKNATASFVTAAYLGAIRLGVPVAPAQSSTASVVVVAGRHTVRSLEHVDISDKIVLYVMPADLGVASQQQIVDQLMSGSQGLVILSNLDSVQFAKRQQVALGQAVHVENTAWVVTVQPDAVAGLKEILDASGVNLARTRTDATPVIRELPSMQVSLDPQFDRTARASATLPNVVGILAGTDSNLKKEYVVFSAHMDHTGLSRGQADSINNGADDNASGTAGLIELAKAFSQSGARPARSLAFVATSGGAKDLWGSNDFAGWIAKESEKFNRQSSRQSVGDLVSGLVSTVMSSFMSMMDGASMMDRADSHGTFVGSIVANVNLDMIGRNAKDSIVVNGLRDVDLATPPTWLAAAHAELGLTVVDGGTVASPASDHFSFVKHDVPSLYFHNGTHTERQSTDSPQSVDTDQEARILRFVFYVGQDIANANQKPRWTPEGRQHYLESR